MLRIRFHGRGGQGVKTASQVLSGALFLEGFTAQDAPRYGAERRGAPVFAYVRAGREPIRERGVIERPDLVVVVDETLVTLGAAGVLQGAGPDTAVLIHSDTPPETWKERTGFPGAVLTLPVAQPAGARCAGAAARLLGVVDRDKLRRALDSELGELGDEALARSRTGALEAFDAFAPKAGLVREGKDDDAASPPPEWIDVPLEPSAVAAPDVRAPATSTGSQTGLWRVLRPVIDHDLCRRCSWVCGTYCPDSAIHVDPLGGPVIDYDHCKGCMVCVSVCPPHAIHAVPEPRQDA
jgi:pyruvate ferredoxin oxidoreductase gamma subunit